MAANQFTMNHAFVAHLSALAGSRNYAGMSTRTTPDELPTIATRAMMNVTRINGGSSVTAHKAAVEWLGDDQKLVLPAMLKNGVGKDAATARDQIIAVHCSFIEICGGDPKAIYARNTAKEHVVEKRNGIDWDDDLDHLFVPLTGDDGKESRFPVAIALAVGDFGADGGWVDIADNEGPRKIRVSIKFGSTEEAEIHLLAEAGPGVVVGVALNDCLMDELFRDQILDYLSVMHGTNCSAQDHDFLSRDGNRWKDNDCSTEHDLVRFTSKLSPHSLGNIAALNLPAVGNNARLAWTRAYAVSCGLLPSDDSIHGVEYCFTEAPPSNAELSRVYSLHVPGQEAQKYMRGCLNIVGAFGALHLANDHTFKERDDSLRRKGIAMINACRTTLEEDEVTELTSDDMLRHSTRTAVHPFGLSSSWGTFSCGQRLGFLSEPLAIRTSVMPPMLQSVSIMVDEANKIFALPIGDKFKKNFKDAHVALTEAKRTMVSTATEYSILHRHYGHADQKKATAEQLAHVETLTYIVTAYCRVFSVDSDGREMGANLSWVLRNAADKNPALVELYANAFEKYADRDATLDDLLGISSVEDTKA